MAYLGGANRKLSMSFLFLTNYIIDDIIYFIRYTPER